MFDKRLACSLSDRAGFLSPNVSMNGFKVAEVPIRPSSRLCSEGRVSSVEEKKKRESEEMMRTHEQLP